MAFKMIAAVDLEGGIGRDGTIPWKLKTDLRRFKALTQGGTVVMGRKTLESLPGPLPDRRHVVLTRDPDWRMPEAFAAPGNSVFRYPDQVRAMATRSSTDWWVIGGAEIYAEFLSDVEDICLTVVNNYYGCDRFFPRVSLGAWRETGAMTFPASADDEMDFRFVTYRRLGAR